MDDSQMLSETMKLLESKYRLITFTWSSNTGETNLW